MSFAFWCILIAAMLPYLWGSLSKLEGSYDNAQPRLHAKTGWRQRADWAQQNSWEAFAPFAAAVIVAHLAQADPARVDQLAGLFILFRGGYGLAYLANRPTLRSLLWVCGISCVIGLFFAAAGASS